MSLYRIEWDEVTSYRTTIEADSMDEAMDKWSMNPETPAFRILGNEVDYDGIYIEELPSEAPLPS